MAKLLAYLIEGLIGIARRTLAVVSVAIVVLAMVAIVFALLASQQYLNLLPPAFRVTKVAYSREECWCEFISLPSDNETGVVAYSLPNEVASDLERWQLAFLRALPPGWRDWKVTPIPPHNWGPDGEIPNADPSMPADDGGFLKTYLNAYGFGIEIDSDVERAIDRAVTAPGNYYSFRSHGTMVLVVPSEQRAYAIWAG